MKIKNQKGFSLIELLIVVVIIGIIAAIAIPNLLAARRVANEGSAILALRTMHGAEVTYSSTTGSGNYGNMTNLASANLIDSTLAASSTAATPKSGYNFTVDKVDFASGVPSQFAIEAHPNQPTGITATGTRWFGIGTDGIIQNGTSAFTVANGVLGGGGTTKVLNN